MLPPKETRRDSRFAAWMRTGFWSSEHQAYPTLEVKFNPYHDPTNGQFTFGPDTAAAARMTRAPKRPRPPREDRRWTGDFSGGGGGTGGGGGATGAHPWPDAAASRQRVEVSEENEPMTVSSSRVRPALKFLQPSKPRSITLVKRNGYVFSLDASHRTRRVAGELTLANAPRSTRNQLRAGNADRLRLDDGGHFIASRFNGPKDAFNHFAQDRSFNRGTYRALEDNWAKEIKSGQHVSVNIKAFYQGKSQRPYSLFIRWSVNGDRRHQNFTNVPGGK